jgi:hypothetical protein
LAPFHQYSDVTIEFVNECPDFETVAGSGARFPPVGVGELGEGRQRTTHPRD